MKILSVVNLKGGTGKTITNVHLGGALAAQGFSTILIDLDLQHGLTTYFEIPAKGRVTSVDVLLDGAGLKDAAQTIRPQLSIVPTTSAMERAELELSSAGGGELRLDFALRELKESAQAPDFVLIDCASGWGTVTRNALLASDAFIVPINSEKLALNAAIKTCNSAQELGKYYRREIKLLGVLLTQWRETNAANAIAVAAARRWNGEMFSKRIRRSEKVNELAIHQQTIADVSLSVGGAAKEDYQAFAEEVIKRCKNQKSTN